MKKALLLVAHGSRQEEANADLYHVVAEMKLLGQFEIMEAAFLEFAEPNIEEGGRRCVALGAEQVVLMPYFLSSGVHFRRDLVSICNRLADLFPRVNFRLAEPLGRHPLLLQVVAERAAETLEKDE